MSQSRSRGAHACRRAHCVCGASDSCCRWQSGLAEASTRVIVARLGAPCPGIPCSCVSRVSHWVVWEPVPAAADAALAIT